MNHPAGVGDTIHTRYILGRRIHGAALNRLNQLLKIVGGAAHIEENEAELCAFAH